MCLVSDLQIHCCRFIYVYIVKYTTYINISMKISKLANTETAKFHESHLTACQKLINIHYFWEKCLISMPK